MGYILGCLKLLSQQSQKNPIIDHVTSLIHNKVSQISCTRGRWNETKNTASPQWTQGEQERPSAKREPGPGLYYSSPGLNGSCKWSPEHPHLMNQICDLVFPPLLASWLFTFLLQGKTKTKPKNIVLNPQTERHECLMCLDSVRLES